MHVGAADTTAATAATADDRSASDVCAGTGYNMAADARVVSGNGAGF